MKHSLCFVSFVSLVVIILSGIGYGGPDSLKVHLNEEFSLYVGQCASIAGEDLQLRFIEVTEDSRCPKGVVCVWAGRVVSEVELTLAGSSYRVTLTESGLTDNYSRERYQEYELAFHVTPYPEAGKEVSTDEYRLHLIVTKLSDQLTEVIGAVEAEPSAFEGRDMVVVGYYRGWDLLREANMAPPVTRSDWVIRDSTGAIYVSANSEAKLPETLRPDSLQYMDVILEVKGIVRVTYGGQPYIEATSIQRVT